MATDDWSASGDLHLLQFGLSGRVRVVLETGVAGILGKLHVLRLVSDSPRVTRLHGLRNGRGLLKVRFSLRVLLSCHHRAKTRSGRAVVVMVRSLTRFRGWQITPVETSFDPKQASGVPLVVLKNRRGSR